MKAILGATILLAGTIVTACGEEDGTRSEGTTPTYIAQENTATNSPIEQQRELSTAPVEADLAAQFVEELAEIRREYETISDSLLRESPSDVRYSDDCTMGQFARILGLDTFDEERVSGFGPFLEERWIVHHELTEELCTAISGMVCFPELMRDMSHSEYKQTVKKNFYQGRLAYIDNRRMQLGAFPTDHQAEMRAREIFGKLALAQDEVSNVRVNQVVTDLIGEEGLIQTTPVETKVRFSRTFNGIEVSESKFMIRLGPEGQLRKVDANWPRVTFPKGTRLRSWEIVEGDIARTLEEMSGRFGLGDCRYRFEYATVDVNGERFFEPVLRIEEPSYNANEISVPVRVHTIPLAATQ